MVTSSKSEFEGQISAIQQGETKMREYARTATEQLVVHLQETGLQNQAEMKSMLAMNTEILNTIARSTEENLKDMRKKTPYEKAKDEFESNKKDLKSSVDQFPLYEANLQRREQNTCKWIFNIDEYKAWYAAPESSLLWVSGGPGFGKSILMSTVIEGLKATCAEQDPVQFFFCKTGDDATQLTIGIMQNMVYQLYALSKSSPDLLDKTNEVLKKALNKKGSSMKEKPNSEKKGLDFQEAYEGLARAYNRTVYLVIDALDECSDRHQQKFLQAFRSMIRTTDIRLKILISSRPEADIADDLACLPNIKLEGWNEEDIRKNVTSQLERIPGWTMTERALACDEVVKKASGQFRYVDLAIKFLRQPWQRPLQNRLKDLPAGLTESYLHSLQQTDPAYLDLLKTSLMWTILAEGDIRVPEVMDAYSRAYDYREDIEELLEDIYISSDHNLHDSQIRTAGGLFLEVSSESRVISLRHKTVKDFFLREEAHTTGSRIGSAEGLCFKCKANLESAQLFRLSEKDGHLEIAKTLSRCMFVKLSRH